MTNEIIKCVKIYNLNVPSVIGLITAAQRTKRNIRKESSLRNTAVSAASILYTKKSKNEKIGL